MDDYLLERAGKHLRRCGADPRLSAPSTPGQFELVKQSALETVPANEHPVFSTSLNVQKGDLLGIHTEFGVPEAYPTSLTGNLVKGLSGCKPEGGLVGAGTSCPLGDIPDHLVNVLAKLIPR